MQDSQEYQHVKRKQRDYPLSLKLQIVQEIEQGKLSTKGAMRKYGVQSRSTVVAWLRKMGNFNWENQTPSNMPKTPEQKLLELEFKIKVLEKKKAFFEHQVEQADKKALIFDMMINLAEKEYNILIRKTPHPNNRPEKKETLTATCALFGLSRQVYYRKIRSTNRTKSLAQVVIDLIIPIRRKMPRIGTRKLYFMLQPRLESLGIGRDKLFTIMRSNHLGIKPERSYRITTDSHHRFRKHKDLLKGLVINHPEQVWVSDITYISSGMGHHYLALVTDAYSKKIVGYDLSNSLSTQGALRAMRMAIKSRVYTETVLLQHSDRGFQYCSKEYQDLLEANKINCSMTTDSAPYSNAVAERVNRIIKNEFCIEKHRVDLITQQKIISETIVIYNHERPHYSCAYLTPNQMHKQFKLSVKTYKNTKGSRLIPATF